MIWHNVIVTGSNVGVGLQRAGVQSNNAVYGNVADYQRSATTGPGFVSVDCLLDDALPPSLGAGSPCRAAGSHEHAPETDYFGTARGNPPAIGAVEP